MLTVTVEVQNTPQHRHNALISSHTVRHILCYTAHFLKKGTEGCYKNPSSLIGSQILLAGALHLASWK